MHVNSILSVKLIVTSFLGSLCKITILHFLLRNKIEFGTTQNYTLTINGRVLITGWWKEYLFNSHHSSNIQNQNNISMYNKLFINFSLFMCERNISMICQLIKIVHRQRIHYRIRVCLVHAFSLQPAYLDADNDK